MFFQSGVWVPQHFRWSFEEIIHLFGMETFGEVFTKFWVLFNNRMCSAQFVYMAHGRQKYLSKSWIRHIFYKINEWRKTEQGHENTHMKGLVTWHHKAMECWCEDQAGPKMDEYLTCAVVTKGGINTKYIVSNVGSATIQGLNSCCGSMRYSASLCSGLAPWNDEMMKSENKCWCAHFLWHQDFPAIQREDFGQILN